MNINMKMKQQDEIYWIRVVLGVMSGLLTGFLGFDSNNPAAAQGIIIPIVVYIFTFYVLRLKRNREFYNAFPLFMDII